MSHARCSILRLETGLHRVHDQVAALHALHEYSNTARDQRQAQWDEIQQSLYDISSVQNRLPLRVYSDKATTVMRAAAAAVTTADRSTANVPNSSHWMSSVPPTGLKVTIPNRGCVVGCKCCCHKRRVTNVSSLHRFLGSLYVGYVGIPYLTPKCDTYHCRQHERLATSMTYTFPP